MRKTIALAGTALILTVGAAPALATPGDDHKVTICHNGQTITIDIAALDAHKHHPNDDLTGPCTPVQTPSPTATSTPSVTPSATPTDTPTCVSWNQHSCEPGNPGPTASPSPTRVWVDPDPGIPTGPAASSDPTPLPTEVVTPSPKPSATPTTTAAPVQVKDPESTPSATTPAGVVNPEATRTDAGYQQLAYTAGGSEVITGLAWGAIGMLFTGIMLMIGKRIKR